MDTGGCPICMEDAGHLLELSCSHKICQTCLIRHTSEQARKRRARVCPLCRASLLHREDTPENKLEQARLSLEAIERITTTMKKTVSRSSFFLSDSVYLLEPKIARRAERLMQRYREGLSRARRARAQAIEETRQCERLKERQEVMRKALVERLLKRCQRTISNPERATRTSDLKKNSIDWVCSRMNLNDAFQVLTTECQRWNINLETSTIGQLLPTEDHREFLDEQLQEKLEIPLKDLSIVEQISVVQAYLQCLERARTLDAEFDTSDEDEGYEIESQIEDDTEDDSEEAQEEDDEDDEETSEDILPSYPCSIYYNSRVMA